MRAKERSRLGWRRWERGRTDFCPAVFSWAGPDAMGLWGCPRGGTKGWGILVASDNKFFH